MNIQTNNTEFPIFVSYAHEDISFLKELLKPFVPLKKQFGFHLWFDGCLEAGDVWESHIDHFLKQARAAILLISQDFMASSFIQEKELPILLKRHLEEHLTIIPILVGPVEIEDTYFSHIQFINPEHELKKLRKYDREVWYAKIAKQAKHIFLSNNLISKTNLNSDYYQNNHISEQAHIISWEAYVPPAFAVNEINHQLNRIFTQTQLNVAIIIFRRSIYYVQFAFYRELDKSSIVIEAISNYFLPADRPLSKLQIKYLIENFELAQPSNEMNFIGIAPFESTKDILSLSKITWEILDKIYNSPSDSKVEISAQGF